jgi:hypothetical protein
VADCDTFHYLVVAKITDTLAVSKRAARKKIVVQRFNLKKLNEGAVKEQYQIAIRNKFAALENLEHNGTSIGHGKVLEKTSNFRLKRVSVTVNRSSTNRGFISNVQGCLMEDSRPNYSGCRT